jgi:ABC-type transport system involved in multi-copper enzyme maturation permease subunit
MILDSVRAEWFKLLRRRAIWVTIALLLAFGVGTGYLVTYLLVTHSPPSQGASADLAALRTDLYPASLVKKSMANASTLDAVFALILGVLAQGSEYAWQTVKTAQTQLPGRLAITLGRLLAIALLILLTVLALYATDALAASLIALADGKSTSLPSAAVVAEGIGAEWLIFGFMAIFGFALATLFRQSAMAIGLGLAYVLLIENLVFGLLRLGDPFKRINDWLPIAHASDLQQSFGQAASVVGIEIVHSGEVDIARAVLVLVLWACGLAVLSGALVRFRDII